MSLDDALVWFLRFGANPQCISPAGRELFAFLLGRVAELERREAARGSGVGS